ncbi:MAG: chorismate mutase [Alphaproteobacteria bacterium]
MPELKDLNSLADIRVEIDRIDASIHDLLMARSEIIERLIAVKRTAETGSAFRPGREADVVRRLVERHRGRLPVEVVVAIWRQMISTFTYVQSPHSVHVVQSPEIGLAGEFARSHFGFGVPLVKHSNPASVIEALKLERGDLGFVMLGAAKTAWWDDLGGEGQPIVMATAPAMTRATDPRPPRAAVLADASIDTAGLDMRVVAFTTERAPTANVDALLAIAEVDGRHHVLAWGAREASDESIARDVMGGVAVEAVRTVGYTARAVAT